MTRAKMILVLLAVVGLCGGTALGATTNVSVKLIANRGNDNNSAGGSYPGEGHNNRSGRAEVRIKGSDHQYYADWDTVPIGNIRDNTGGYSVSSYTLNIVPDWPPGWRATNDWSAGAEHWQLDQAGTPATPHIACIWSENDWVEANGSSYANYNWSSPTVNFAATYMYAQDVEDPLIPDTPDMARVVNWVSPTTLGPCTFLGTFLDQGDKWNFYGHGWDPSQNLVNSIQNSTDFSIVDADIANYVSAPLDQAVIDDLVDNADNRGLVVYLLPPPDNWNREIRSRRYGGDNKPYLEATIDDVHVGDANLDRCVDGLDYVLWSNNYQQAATWLEADFNGDDYADGLDYVSWSNNYNAGCPGTPGAVPGPATMALLAIGALALMRRRRRS